ncbi:hypothetical protein BTEBP_20030 [Brochothrix thermosphacta]|nr:hypothetical protein BTEBP_20030 [Brochothrix thermosphacta]
MVHKYVDTLNNKDHGRNLQHKLFLEKNPTLFVFNYSIKNISS